MAQDTTAPKFMRPTQAAKQTGIGKRTIYRWAEKGHLKLHQPGPQVTLVDMDELRAFITSKEGETQ